MNHSFLQNINSKNALLKQSLLKSCVNEGDFNIADISKELNTSIPTATKLVGELIEEGFIEDKGKCDTNGGRRPSMYGLNPSAGYFIGVEVKKNEINIAVMDFKGAIINYINEIPFELESNRASIDNLCNILNAQLSKIELDQNKIRAYGFNLTGRVNYKSGYSFSYFLGEEKPIQEYFEQKLNAPVYIDNDSRAMTYGEYMCGICQNEQNILFINLSMGLGMGMIIDGKLNYGKSGFSGEIGHFPLLENEKICKCGKIGCLETEASGWALQESFIEKLKEGRASCLLKKYEKKQEITVEDILNAALDEDVLAIECIEEVGRALGRAIAGLINIFNPELVVIGGLLAAAKDYLMIPIKGAINKFSLTIVNKDTSIKFSKLGNNAGPIGACMLSRSKLLGLI